MRPTTYNLLRGAIAQLSVKPLTWAVNLATLLVMPHALGDVGYGQLTLAVTVAGIVGTIAALGVPNELPRRVANQPEQAALYLYAATSLILSVSLIGAIGVVVTLGLLGFRESRIIILVLSMTQMLLGAPRSALLAVLQGQQRHERFAWSAALASVVESIAGVAVALRTGDLIAIMTAEVLVGFAALFAIWCAAGLRPQRAAFRLLVWKELVRGGATFLFSNLTTTARRSIGVLLVGLLLSSQAVGWLAVAYRLISVGVFIPTMISNPLLPALSRESANAPVFQRALRHSLILVALLSVVVSALLIGVAPIAPSLLHWGADFEKSAPLIVVLAAVQPIIALDMVLGTAVFAMRRERRLLTFTIVGSIVGPLVAVVMVPVCTVLLQHGAIGATLSDVALELVMAIGMFVVLPRGLVGAVTLRQLSAIAVAGVCLVVLVRVLLPISWPLAVTTGCLAYLAIVASLKILRVSDIQLIWGVVLQPVRRSLFA